MKQFENIPEELKLLQQWVCHRDRKPFNPVIGDIPVNGRRKGFIEGYKAVRYFTMTGNVYSAVKPINERTEQLKHLFQKYFPDLKSEESVFEAALNISYISPAKDYLSIGLSKDSVFKVL